MDQLTFSVRPCLAKSSFISLCFSAEKIINADLNLFGASGAFLYFGPEDVDLLGFGTLGVSGPCWFARLPCLPLDIALSSSYAATQKSGQMREKI